MLTARCANADEHAQIAHAMAASILLIMITPNESVMRLPFYPARAAAKRFQRNEVRFPRMELG